MDDSGLPPMVKMPKKQCAEETRMKRNKIVSSAIKEADRVVRIVSKEKKT